LVVAARYSRECKKHKFYYTANSVVEQVGEVKGGLASIESQEAGSLGGCAPQKL